MRRPLPREGGTKGQGMAKNYRFADYPATLFDLAAAPADDGAVKLTIGATGPRRQGSPWQEEFEAWAKRYKFQYECQPDIGQKGIRRREVTVVIDTMTILEMVLVDIAQFHDITVPLIRNDEILAAERRERKAELFSVDGLPKRSKAKV
jgi:hypothetical protein